MAGQLRVINDLCDELGQQVVVFLNVRVVRVHEKIHRDFPVVHVILPVLGCLGVICKPPELLLSDQRSQG